MMSTTFTKKYKVLSHIGEGAFSEVLKCQERETGNLYAAKRLKKDYTSLAEVTESPEVIAMRKLSHHPNILHIIEFHVDPMPGKVTFIFELMEMSLYDMMKNRKRPLPEMRVKRYLYQLLKGLDHLHHHGLFHRDIKPENILIKNEIIKIADLGSIRGAYSRPPYTEYISTRWYRSPECLLTTGYYGPKMDVWACGCVFFELLTTKPLFPGTNEVDQISKIHDVLGTPHTRLLAKFHRHKSRNCEYFFQSRTGSGLASLVTNLTENGRDILKQMLTYDPEHRSNVRRLLEHRYFNDLRLRSDKVKRKRVPLPISLVEKHFVQIVFEHHKQDMRLRGGRWHQGLTNLEIELIKEFIQYLSRSNCVLVDDANGFKEFATNFVSSSYLPASQLSRYLIHHDRHGPERIVLVFRGSDLSIYREILDQVYHSKAISRFTWIAVLNESLDLSAIQFQVRIPYNCEFFLVEPAGEDRYQIREIYSGRNVVGIYSSHYGVWSIQHGLLSSKLNFFARRRDMRGYPMVVLALKKNCQSLLYCSLLEIWLDLARYLNITTILSTYEEHERKIHETNRVIPWDVILEPMTYDAYTFSTKAIAPIWRITVYMHVRHESDQEFSWPAYFSVFWGSSILYFLLWLVGLILWLTVFDYYQSSIVRKRNFHSSNGFFAVLYWICNQGGIYMEPNVSLIFVILMVRIVVLVVQILGTGSIVSSIALRIPHYPFYELEGFLQDGTYKLGIVNGSLSQFYFELSPMTSERELWRKFLPTNQMPRTLTEAMEMVCEDGKFVALADNNDLMALPEKNCQILRIPFPVATISCGMPLEDESPFEFIFNSAFTRIVESGIIDKMRKRLSEKVAMDVKESHLHSVAFRQVRPFFVLIEVGLLISFIAFILEVFRHFREPIKKEPMRVRRRRFL